MDDLPPEVLEVLKLGGGAIPPPRPESTRHQSEGDKAQTTPVGEGGAKTPPAGRPAAHGSPKKKKTIPKDAPPHRVSPYGASPPAYRRVHPIKTRSEIIASTLAQLAPLDAFDRGDVRVTALQVMEHQDAYIVDDIVDEIISLWLYRQQNRDGSWQYKIKRARKASSLENLERVKRHTPPARRRIRQRSEPSVLARLVARLFRR